MIMEILMIIGFCAVVKMTVLLVAGGSPAGQCPAPIV